MRSVNISMQSLNHVLEHMLPAGLLADEGFVAVKIEEEEDVGEVPGEHMLERCFQLAEDANRDEIALAKAFWKAWRICRPESAQRILSEEEAEKLLTMANSTYGPLMQSCIDQLEQGGEAIGWSFRVGAEDGRPFRVERPLASKKKILRWRAVHPSGLGGMFTSGLGLVEKCLVRKQPLLIDWSSKALLYRGHAGCNAWEEFFTQPAAAMLSPQELEDALASGDFHDFHGTPCMNTPKVGLPLLHAARGRLLCSRFAWMKPELRCVAREFADRELPGCTDSSVAGGNRKCQWLAVHVRRSDKGDESPENLALSEEEIVRQAKMTCLAWGCGGVYLASDDWKLKFSVCPALRREGLQVGVYSPALSADVSQCTHMNQSLEAHRKTWDACFEVAVMSLCIGLLCTHSFMANMAVYYSKPPYPYRTFWGDRKSVV